MTYNKLKYSKLFVYGVFFLLISMSTNVVGDGSSAIESDYDGPPLLIPLIDNSPTIDGIATAIEFPKQGHIGLPGLLDEMKISHNNTALFLAITVDAEEFVGFAIQSRGGHGASLTDFAYFVSGVKDNQTEQLIRVDDNDYDNPLTVESNAVNFIVDVVEEDDRRVYELMISIDNNKENDEPSDDHDPIEDLIPRLGTIFNLIILNGEGEDVTSLDLSKSPIIPAYLLRQGENPNEIKELLENNPSWVEVLVFPLILLSLSVYFVWKYKLVIPRRGEN